MSAPATPTGQGPVVGDMTERLQMATHGCEAAAAAALRDVAADGVASMPSSVRPAVISTDMPTQAPAKKASCFSKCLSTIGSLFSQAWAWLKALFCGKR